MSDYKLFLLKLDISGIKNLKDTVSLNFYKNTISANNFNTENYNVKGIYGENGSGKTSIITAVQILSNLLGDKNYLTSSSNIVLLNELINKITNKMSISCEYAFKDNELFSIFKYSIIIDRLNENEIVITNEELSHRSSNKAKWKIDYSIKNGNIEILNTNSNIYEYIIEYSKNLLTTRPLINLFDSQENFYKLFKNHDNNNNTQYLFNSIFVTILFSQSLYVYLDKDDTHEIYVRNSLIDKYKTFSSHQRIDYLKVSNIVVDKSLITKFKQTVNNLCEFIKIFKDDLLEIIVDEKENKDKYICSLIFKYEDYELYGEFESTGIKKLVRLFTALCNVDNGGIVFIDEFDANIHDVYLCKILEYFINYGSGQLCFTTHNLGPMEVLDTAQKSIDFLSKDNTIVPWTKNGNYSVRNLYSKGMIEKSPFNIEPFNFIGIFKSDEDN